MEELHEYLIDLEYVENKLVELLDCAISRLMGKRNKRCDGESAKWYLEVLFKRKRGIEENIIFKRSHRSKSSLEGRRSKSKTMFCWFRN